MILEISDVQYYDDYVKDFKERVRKEYHSYADTKLQPWLERIPRELEEVDSRYFNVYMGLENLVSDEVEDLVFLFHAHKTDDGKQVIDYLGCI